MLGEKLTDSIVQALAKAASLHKAQELTLEEMQQLVDALFGCSNPNHTPSGKKIVQILPLQDIDKYFS